MLLYYPTILDTESREETRYPGNAIYRTRWED